jgi:hypothetical protein
MSVGPERVVELQRSFHVAGEVRLMVGDIADLLHITPSTWRSLVAKGIAPKPDGQIDKRTPYWTLGTMFDYVASDYKKY